MSHKAAYLLLNTLHDKLPLFFQPWWLDMVSDDWDIALSENADGSQGVFPYCLDRKLGVRLLRNPSLTPYLGPVILKDNAIIFAGNNPQYNDLLEDLFAQIPKAGSIDIETTIYFNNCEFIDDKGFDLQEKLTYELSLAPDTAQIYKGFHNNHRKLIRLANDCHTIEEGIEHLETFLPLHEKTYTRKGKKYYYDAAYIRKLITTSIKQHAGQLFSARNEQGAITACLFTVWDKQKMYLLLSAVNTENAHHGAGRLLIWHAIQLAKQMGLAVFDFEGSMDERVGNIYKRFGGERKTYLCISKTNSIIWKWKKRLLG